MKKIFVSCILCIIISFSRAQVVFDVSTTGSNLVNINPLLFGANSEGIYDDFAPETDANFETLLNTAGITSMYFPGGSIARLYHYYSGIHGHGVSSTEDADLEGACDNTCASPHNDDCRTCDDAGESSFFEEFAGLCNTNDDGAPYGTLDIGIALCLNMYFDRNNADFENMLTYLDNFSNKKLDLIVMGTEIHLDNFYSGSHASTYFGTTYSSQLAGYTGELDQKMTTAGSNKIGSRLSAHGYTSVQLAYGAGKLTSAGTYDSWNTTVSSYTKNVNKVGAINWWWYPQDNTSDDPAAALADMQGFFTNNTSGDGRWDLPELTDYFNANESGGAYSGYYNQMHVVQWGIKKTGIDIEYGNTLLGEIFAAKRLFYMINYNANGSDFFKSAYFMNVGKENYDIIADYDSDGDLDLTATGDAFADLKYCQGKKYAKAITFTDGGSAPVNVEAYFFRSSASNWKLFVINTSGTEKTMTNVKINGTNYSGELQVDNTYGTDVLAVKAASGSDIISHGNTVSAATGGTRSIILKPYSITEIYPTGAAKMSSTEIEENISSIDMYPNPAGNTLHVSSDLAGRFVLTIFDAAGNIVFSSSYANENSMLDENLDISGLANGIYILQAESNDNSITKKFTVAK